jgi:cytochrome c oxidase subunit 1
VSDVLSVFARKPLFGYRPMIYAIAAIAGLGFIVWGHHMFVSGMNPALGTTFTLSTIMIALPSAIKTFNWLGTLWGGSIRFTTPMLNALAFVSMFVIGGLSGIFMASTPVDLHIHDTYFIVAHLHYVLFGGSIFGAFAGIYYWFPKMFGRMMSETWGRIHFLFTFIAYNCTFFAMHILGMGGMPRRYAGFGRYRYLDHLVPVNEFITISAFVLGAVQVIFAINFFYSMFKGKPASRNPWHANTLEWQTGDPKPGHGNFVTTPIVYRGPYEYSSPQVDEDYLPQTRKLGGGLL